DYVHLLSNMHRSLSAITIGEAYLYGDMNGDRQMNFFDLAAFSEAYDAAHGAGAFALIGTAVPEPGTFALFTVAIAVMGGLRWIRASAVACVALGASLVVEVGPVSAQDVVYIDAEQSNTVLE